MLKPLMQDLGLDPDNPKLPKPPPPADPQPALLAASHAATQPVRRHANHHP